MFAERLYQAIIDKVAEDGLDWDESARSCGFDPDTLLECFQGKPNSRDLRIYDYLDRHQIEATADFLVCPRVRIFFLADVFNVSDMHMLAKAVTGDAHFTRNSGLKVLAQYIADISRSQFFGKPEPLLNEFVAATISENLREACTKTGLPYTKLAAWRTGRHASIKDIEDIRGLAKAIGIGIAPALVALGIMQPDDFFWRGAPVDPIAELEHALDVDIW